MQEYNTLFKLQHLLLIRYRIDAMLEAQLFGHGTFNAVSNFTPHLDTVAVSLPSL